jgi:Ferritin-like domain
MINTATSSISADRVSTRRNLLKATGYGALSAAAVALVAGSGGTAARAATRSKTDPENDVAILNVALGVEWEGIGAYQLGAESGLLRPETLRVAVLFQSQHKEHADALTVAITRLGGQPVQPLSQAEYAEAIAADRLKTETDVLKLAARLEKGAANAYLGVIPAFADPTFGQICGRLAADEAMHWTVLAQALGQALPEKALTFGA